QQEPVAYVADRLRGKKHRELRDLLFDAARVETGDAEQRRVWLSEVAEICEGPLRDVDGAIEARRQLVLLDPSDDEAADHLEQILQKAEKWDELAELLLRRAEVDADEEMRVERALRAAVIHRDQRRDNLAAGNAYAWVAELNPTDSENA